MPAVSHVLAPRSLIHRREIDLNKYSAILSVAKTSEWANDWGATVVRHDCGRSNFVDLLMAETGRRAQVRSECSLLTVRLDSLRKDLPILGTCPESRYLC
jgi:hypothetical protein